MLDLLEFACRSPLHFMATVIIIALLGNSLRHALSGLRGLFTIKITRRKP